MSRQVRAKLSTLESLERWRRETVCLSPGPGLALLTRIRARESLHKGVDPEVGHYPSLRAMLDVVMSP